MWADPDKAILTYPLFGGDTLEFGWARSAGGMSVGTNPLMARVLVPRCSGGYYPSGWFVVQGKPSITKVKAEFDKFGGEVFIPDWLRADMFEHHYNLLRRAAGA
jgi:hypothetical protein